jgi:urease accessory protein
MMIMSIPMLTGIPMIMAILTGMGTLMIIMIMDTIMVIRMRARIAIHMLKRMCMTRIATMTMIMTTTMITTIATRMDMDTRISMIEGSTLPLLVWLSPSFPVGAFAYSHGLEWAFEAGDIIDADTCRAWITDLLQLGSARTDAVLLAAAYRAAQMRDAKALKEVAELAVALQPSAERHLEATTQGHAFMTVSQAAWPSDALAFFKAAYQGETTYPVAVAVAGEGFGMDLRSVLEAFVLAFVTNLVSASVRLGAIGQTDGQRVIAALLPLVRVTALWACDTTLEDLGSCAFRSDLASLHHETQYTRLFRS